MKISARDLVKQEVIQSASYLIATIASGYCQTEAGELSQLCEQAAELCFPIEDYESAAIDAGWSYTVSRIAGNPYFEHADHGKQMGLDGWQDLCEEFDIEPYQREILEHWIVSDWLADCLIEKGERVDKDFAGLCIWGRTTSGQAVYMDYVIEQIAAELNARNV